MHTSAFILQVWAAAAIALLVDRWLGEPPVRWHPVVWMGRYLQAAGAWLQARVPAVHAATEAGTPHASSTATVGATNATDAPDYPSFWRGACAWLGGALLVLLPASLLQWLLWQLPWLAGTVLMGLLLKPLLAWRMLAQEVLAVERALAQSLEAGRQQLARIVSRDVQQLDASQIRESALESLAENLNDSVIAPLCWFGLLGLPGAALYRYADTADSMWGYRGTYRGQRWEWAGKWAARADDVLAWLPARLSGLALCLLGGLQGATRLRAEACHTPSPNSGWPMAAMALALNIRLRKPGVYTLHAAGSPPRPAHAAQAVLLGQRAVWLALAAMPIATASLIVGARACLPHIALP